MQALQNDRNIDILRRYQSEEPLAAIGGAYGITKERVRQIAMSLGAEGRRGGHLPDYKTRAAATSEAAIAKAKLRAEKIRKADKLVEDGWSHTKARAKVGLSSNIKLTVPSKHGRWNADLPTLRDAAVQMYTQEKLSIGKIAIRIGKSVPFVRSALAKANVEVKYRSKQHGQ